MKWQTDRLGNIVTLKRGFDLPESKRVEGDVPIISSSGIFSYHNEKKLDGPGVVTGRYGTLGEVFYVEGPYWPLNTSLYVQDFHGNDPRFISYFLRNHLKGIKSDKAAVPGVNRNDLHEHLVKIPDVTSQPLIASILSAYDDLIANNRRRIQLLEQAARHIYKEWFVRLRFPGYERTRVVAGVPNGWEKGTIADFYLTGSGGTPSRKNPAFFEGTINWVKTQELLDRFIFSTDEKITEEAVANSATKILPPETVLLAMYGATIGQTGILAVPAAVNQACCTLQANDKRANYVYAYLFLRENKLNLQNLSQGAAQRNVNQQVIKQFSMMMPPKELMDNFLSQAQHLLEQIKTLQLMSSRLEQARDLLLPRLMSGDIDVS